MDRRKFITALLGVAGAAAVASTLRPAEAFAAMPSADRGGILDELDADTDLAVDDGEKLEAQQVWHRGRPHRWGPRRDRPWRRRPRAVWRRVCQRVRRRGHWVRRCWRERVWLY